MAVHKNIVLVPLILSSTIMTHDNQQLCPPGYFLDTAMKPLGCSQCPEEKYTTEPNIYWECHNCMSCPHGTINVSPCTRTSNLICKCRLKGQIFVTLEGGDGDGACFCKSGTFMMNDECVNHTLCPEGVKIIRNGTEYEDTVCDYVSSTTTLKTTTTTLERATTTVVTPTLADATTRLTSITTASESANLKTIIIVLISIIIILVILNIGLCVVCLRRRQHRNLEFGTAQEREHLIVENEIYDV